MNALEDFSLLVGVRGTCPVSAAVEVPDPEGILLQCAIYDESL